MELVAHCNARRGRRGKTRTGGVRTYALTLILHHPHTSPMPLPRRFLPPYCHNALCVVAISAVRACCSLRTCLPPPVHYLPFAPTRCLLTSVWTVDVRRVCGFARLAAYLHLLPPPSSTYCNAVAPLDFAAVAAGRFAQRRARNVPTFVYWFALLRACRVCSARAHYERGARAARCLFATWLHLRHCVCLHAVSGLHAPRMRAVYDDMVAAVVLPVPRRTCPPLPFRSCHYCHLPP